MRKIPLPVKGRFLLFWGLGGICELLFLADILLSSFLDHPVLGILMHGLAALLLFFALPKGESYFDPMRGGRLFFALTLTLPFFGWLVIPFFFFFSEGKAEPLASFEDEIENSSQIPPASNSETKIEELSPKKKIISALDFIPLVDILHGPEDLPLKRGAIDKLSRFGTPEAIDTLLSLRNHPQPEVRFFATASLSRLKNEFDEQLEASKVQMKKDIYKISARTYLAKIYDRYASSGLLDPVTSKAYEDEAIYHIQEALKTEYAKEDDYWFLVDILSHRKNAEAALSLLDEMKEKGISTPEARARKRAELFYDQGDYPAVQAELRTLAQLPDQKQELSSLLFWWGAA